jgi:hypothetical protein
MRRLRTIAACVIVLYALLTLAIWVVMRRPPEQFGEVMKHVPGPVMMVLPFETLWLQARTGALHVGDPAPDFNLESVDRRQRAQLSADRGRPVVLIFGSYT